MYDSTTYIRTLYVYVLYNYVLLHYIFILYTYIPPLYTGADPVRMARVKNALGCAFQPLLGNVNGYYSLNLAVDTDRLCLSHLLGHSKSVNTKRSKQQAKNLMNYNNYSIGKVNDIIYVYYSMHIHVHIHIYM